MQHRPRLGSLVVALVALAGGLLCLYYQGDHYAFVRGHLGDVAAVAFLVALLGVTTRLRRGPRVALALALAGATEAAQALGWAPRGGAGELLVGAHFDAVDLVAYVVGAGLAAAAEAAAEGAVAHERRGA